MNIIKRLKIFKNEPCPCGSGNRYSECCFNKIDDEFDLEHLQKFFLNTAKWFDTCKFEVCLHPTQSECKPPIKHAHSMQNHGVLSQISYKNHVIAFNTLKTKKMDIVDIKENVINVQNTLGLVGVNEATTQTCFCNYHDSVLFAPIESNPVGFTPTDKQQLFLYAYKAFAFEYYKSKVALIALNSMFKKIPQKLKKYPLLFVPHYREAQLKDSEMEYYKSFFDRKLVQNDYSEIETEVIEIPYKINFATTECITPSCDLSGERVQKFNHGMMRRMFINIFPNNNNSYLLISYLIADKVNFARYASLLKSANINTLTNYLSTFLPLYSENLVISPRLWDKWGKEKQSAFNNLINVMSFDFAKYEKYLMLNLKKIYKQRLDISNCLINLFDTL